MRNAIRVGWVLLAVVALYWPDAAALGRYWAGQDANAQTGVLIALLSGFLLFRDRRRFEHIVVGPVPWAGLPLIACAAASLICWRAGIVTLQLVFLPPILWLGVLTVLGWPAARLAFFPIGFLYFALPGWGLLGPSLQRLTAWAVGLIGPAMGLPLTLSGTTVLLPGGISFAIAPPCSGVDFLTIGIAIAALHGKLENARLGRRVGLIGSMILVAIVSNWLRVMLIIDIGYRSQMRNPLATRDHLALGWVVFACALLLFLWVAGRPAPTGPGVHAAGKSHGGIATAPQRSSAWRHGTAFVALLLVPALVYLALLGNGARAIAGAFELPPACAPWSGPADWADPLWQPKFVGAHAERQVRYESADGRTVEVVAIGFPHQAQGRQILNERNSLLGEHGLSLETVALLLDADTPHAEVIARDTRGRRSLIWSVIDIGGHLFGEPVTSQLWYGARSIMGDPYSALFALRAQCDISCDGARAALADFLRVNGSALFASLPTPQ